MAIGPLSSPRQIASGTTAGAGAAPPALRVASVFGWLSQSVLAERDRWPLWLPVALGAGIGLYFSLYFEPTPLFAAALGISGLLLGIAAIGTETPLPKAAQALLAAALIGFALAKYRTDSVAAPILAHRTFSVVEGHITSLELHGKGVRALLDVEQASRLSLNGYPKAARIFIRSGGGALVPGDRIRVRAVLLPPPEPAAPGAYDFGRSAFFQQIGAVGFAYGKPQLLLPEHIGLGDRIRIGIQGLRWRISNRIRSALPGSTGSIAASLITGDRGGISDDDQTALRDAGLAHVLAISGLNMALVGLGLFWAVRAFLALFPGLALTQPIKKWAAVLALCSTAFYLLISGASAPAVRAFLMLATMLLAILIDRPALSMRSVALAAVILLLFQPESLIDPGFQMSFAAVASLIAVAEWERSRQSAETATTSWAKIRKYIRGGAVTSLVGSLATAPFAIYHFDRATHYAILGNLAAMPVIGFVIMPAAAVSVMLMPFGLEAYPLHIMGWGIDAMLAIGRRVSALPGAVSVIPAWPMSVLLLLTAAGLWMIVWRGRLRWLAIVPLVVAGGLLAGLRAPDILVARDGKTVAFRNAQQRMVFVQKPSDEFSATEWLKRDGDALVPANAIAGPGDHIGCDSSGCVVRLPSGLMLAVASRQDALDEDCATANVVVSAIPTRGRCARARFVIDRFDVSRNGAYAVSLHDGIHVETTRQRRGERPWSTTAPRRQYRRINPTSLP